MRFYVEPYLIKLYSSLFLYHCLSDPMQIREHYHHDSELHSTLQNSHYRIQNFIHFCLLYDRG